MFSLNSIVNLNTRVMVITMVITITIQCSMFLKLELKYMTIRRGVAHNISCIKCVYYTGGR